MTQVVNSDATPPESPYQRERAESVLLVSALRDGDENAFGKLYDLWFDRVYDVAYRVVRDPHDASEVAQDAFLSAWRNIGGLDDPAAFGGWILRISRNLAFNRRKKEKRSSPFDAEGMSIVEANQGRRPGGPAGFAVEDRLSAMEDPARAAEDAEVCALLWDAADALGERDAAVLDLHLRRSLSPAEIADELGITRNNANQLLHRLRQRLGTAVKARVLWRHGAPTCPSLAHALSQAGVAEFGKDAVDVIGRHVDGCADCSERQATRVAPAALFAATPFVAAPLVLKEQVAAALESDGVGMDGSHFADGGAHHGVWATAAGEHDPDGANVDPAHHDPGQVTEPQHSGSVHQDALHHDQGHHDPYHASDPGHEDPFHHDDPFHLHGVFHPDDAEAHELLAHDDPGHHDHDHGHVQTHDPAHDHHAHEHGTDGELFGH